MAERNGEERSPKRARIEPGIAEINICAVSEFNQPTKASSQTLAEAAFDVAIQCRLVDLQCNPKTLDTRYSRAIQRAADKLGDVIDAVRHRSVVDEHLINRLSAYLQQDPQYYWYLQNDQLILDFLAQIQQDLDALVRRLVECRSQDGLGIISAYLHNLWICVPHEVVRSWLGEDSVMGDQTVSDSVFQAVEVLDEFGYNRRLFNDFIKAFDMKPPSSIMDTPTGLTESEDEASEAEESEDDSEAEDPDGE